jgi:hypothetical protein
MDLGNLMKSFKGIKPSCLANREMVGARKFELLTLLGDEVDGDGDGDGESDADDDVADILSNKTY